MTRIHPREKITRMAEAELRNFLVSYRDKLTEGEFLRMISNVLSDEWSSTAKYMIREERHPDDPNKPGGLE